MKILTTKAPLDSGCIGSAINRAYMQLHQLDTRKAAVPIPMYNTDRTHNKAGNITEFVELRMTIGGHSKRIDLTVTDLVKKDVYLGHDWLKRHNPSVNWKTGTIIFGHCQCIKNHLELPDADPNDCWNKELKEGDTILTVRMEEELVICAMHYANKLATATNTDKPKKMFKEMVPSHYHSFHDLFSKENFDELPK